MRAWVADWQRTTINLEESTRVRTDGILRNYVLSRFGHRQVASITYLEVKAWIAELSASGLGPRTVRKIGQVFGQVMAAAVDAGLNGEVRATACHIARHIFSIPMNVVRPSEPDWARRARLWYLQDDRSEDEASI